MKIAATIARYLMGIMFLVFGLNGFLQFLPQPPMSGFPQQFFTVMMGSHYMVPVFLIQILCALLFLANRYIPLALTLIGPVLVNILIFHITMQPAGLGPGILVTIFWFLVFSQHRAAFAGIFQQNG